MDAPIVTLRLIFYGLIAFTPSDFDCGRPMRAMLIDARNPPVASDGCPIHEHVPELMFQSLACLSPCKIDRGLCTCELKRDLLHVGSQPDDVCYEKRYLHPLKVTQRVTDPTCSDDFRYISKMSWLRLLKIPMRLRQECNVACPGPGTREDDPQRAICPLITAQINFAPDRIDVCALAGQSRDPKYSPCDGSGPCAQQTAQKSYPSNEIMVPEFRFRPVASRNFLEFLGLINIVTRNRKILSEITMFEQDVQVPGAAVDAKSGCPAELELEVMSFDRTEHYTFSVEVTYDKARKRCLADLIVANAPVDHHSDLLYERCAQNLVARDFELFHDLVSSPMPPADRCVPQFPRRAEMTKVERERCDPSPTLDILLEQILRTGTELSICPKASAKPNN